MKELGFKFFLKIVLKREATLISSSFFWMQLLAPVGCYKVAYKRRQSERFFILLHRQVERIVLRHCELVSALDPRPTFLMKIWIQAGCYSVNFGLIVRSGSCGPTRIRFHVFNESIRA